MVRVEVLMKGQKFTCVSGRHWTFVRRHQSNSGAYIAVDSNGREDCFAGCALVMLGVEPAKPR